MIKIENLSRIYKISKDNSVTALQNIKFEIPQGGFSAMVGPSGSGKSTILNILGGLDMGYEGNVFVDGENLRDINQDKYRRYFVQTIFQQFYLVPTLSVVENITLPVLFGSQFSKKDLAERSDYILNKVGLFDRRNHKPKELSGGQIQRVAIARALITSPKILLGDEPTGNLDTKTGNEIMELLHKINEEEKTTTVIITHDLDIIKNVKHKVFLRDGKIERVEGQ